MIEELLSSVVEVDNNRTKLSHSHIPSVLTSPSQSPTTSSSETIITANAANNQNNLRCPRCDSSNTKFCYYNNYNLTQPRHFCKTCRRYWTKGGALRNVPIGGGCRKTKSAVSPPSIVKSSGMPSCTKPNNTMTSLDFMGRAVPDVLLPSSPILWAGMPQSSHLLALLRASQMQQNPNPSFFNSVRVKEEGGRLDANGGCVNLENFGGFPVNTGGAPLWRSTENQYQFMMNGNQQVQQAPTQSLLLSEVPTSSGIQELYQRLKSSTMGSYGGDSEQFQGNGSNVGVATSVGSSVNVASSSIMDQIPLTGGEFGYWNPMMAWSDLSTANGAFP